MSTNSGGCAHGSNRMLSASDDRNSTVVSFGFSSMLFFSKTASLFATFVFQTSGDCIERRFTLFGQAIASWSKEDFILNDDRRANLHANASAFFASRV